MDHSNRGQHQRQLHQHRAYYPDWAVLEWDVLCGREKRATSHPGTQRFRDIVQSYCGRYQNTERRSEKADIANEIISVIHGDGSRFLKQSGDGSGWVQLDDATVKEKVSHALRSTKAKGDGGDGGSESSTRQAEQDKEVEEAVVVLSKKQQEIYQDLLQTNCPKEPPPSDDHDNSNRKHEG